MRQWPGLISGALLMALAWALAWAPLGLLAGMILDPDGSMDEPWVAVGAYPGFLCGAIFHALPGRGGGRRLAGLSLPRAAARGAASGLLVGLLPFVLGTPRTWLLGAAITVSVTLLGAVSAVVSASLAGRARREP